MQGMTGVRKLLHKGTDKSASKMAWEFNWLHAVMQSREKCSMENVKMT